MSHMTGAWSAAGAAAASAAAPVFTTTYVVVATMAAAEAAAAPAAAASIYQQVQLIGEVSIFQNPTYFNYVQLMVFNFFCTILY